MSTASRQRVLVVYDDFATHTSTVMQHLESFGLSRHEVHYAVGARAVPLPIGLAAFDAVIVHYSVRLSLPDFISPDLQRQLPGFSGLKILYIQDEYDTTETARKWMERLAFQVVFTCVPAASIALVYPSKRFPKTEFVPTLTGFVPPQFERPLSAPPMSVRPLRLAYRGRALPVWYGQLGREKLLIGQRMKEICRQQQVACDIEWEEQHRIYGEDWYRFLMSARATLATESGSNVFDDDGSIRRSVEAELVARPQASFDELYARHVAPHDGKIKMNQISPRVFEAISVGTGLVLFEGEYSGVLQPWVHYLPLAKDFSNASEILAKLSDDAFMTELVGRAHRDVIESGKYSYRAAIIELDQLIDRLGRRARTLELFSVVLGVGEPPARPTIGVVSPERSFRSFATSAPLTSSEADRNFTELVAPSQLLARGAWRVLPARLRTALGPIVRRARGPKE